MDFKENYSFKFKESLSISLRNSYLITSKAGLSIPQIRTTVRQKEKSYKDAVNAISKGEVDKGFNQLDSL